MRDRNRPATERLRSLVRPFILRRMKTDRAIIKDLPDKVEQNSYCNLTPEQATLYEAVVRDLEAKLKDADDSGRQGLLLSTLLRLKQICNHPAQFLQDASEFTETRSHKLARVCEMLDEIEAERESVLVFTQFTEIGKSLEALFRRRYTAARCTICMAARRGHGASTWWKSSRIPIPSRRSSCCRCVPAARASR